MILKLKSSNVPQKSVDGTEIVKISSSIGPLEFVEVFRVVDNKVNPRNQTSGKIVRAIQETLDYEPNLLLLKSKGILFSSKHCEILERNRVKLTFDDPKKEGVMDGGHNVLAIAEHIANMYDGTTFKNWQEAKKYWDTNFIELHKFVSDNLSEFPFLIPIEIITTNDHRDSEDQFDMSIAEICSARNNNNQLKVEDKSHQKGNYDYLKSILGNHDIQWKDGEGGAMKSKDIIILSTIPLLFLAKQGLLPKTVGSMNPISLYSGKNHCLSFYDKVVTDDTVGTMLEGRLVIGGNKKSETDRKKYKNGELVKSALRMTEDIMHFYDRLFLAFPDLYNSHGGAYGGIGEVEKTANQSARNKTPKYHTIDATTKVPVFEPYIMPIVYGLISMMKYDKSKKALTWKRHPDAIDLRKLNLTLYKHFMTTEDFNPQRVGKNPGSYETAEQLVYRDLK